MLKILKGHLCQAQNRMKKYVDRNQREVELEVWDKVYLKTRPYRYSFLTKHRNEKLKPKFFGLYKILQKIGAMAYKLDLPPEISIHPIFHTSQLKKAVEDVGGSYADSPSTY